MMPTDRFERQLPALLDELAKPQTPAYFDSLLGQTARTRQRPAWTILERWLPMVDVARQPVIAPRLPLRTVGLGLLLIGLILAVVAAIAIGSRPNLPAPFGPAHNGLVAYSANGDIFVVDSVSGRTKAVVTGPELDLHPVWSRDGTQITFERKVTTEAGPESILVVPADGGQPRALTGPLSDIGNVSFSPDGRRLLFHATVDAVPTIHIAAVDGSGVRRIDIGRPVAAWAWRPPLGDEILFTDMPISTDQIGLYAINPDGGQIRTILPEASGVYRGFQTWSPDGTRIAYGEYTEVGRLIIRTHVINADGTGDRVLALPSGAAWEAPTAWSNDGTRLLTIRGYGGGSSTTRAGVRPVDGTDTGIEINYPGAIQEGCCIGAEWAPDDTSILVTPTSEAGLPLQQVMLDPRNGTTTTVPWSASSDPTWQRLAD